MALPLLARAVGGSLVKGAAKKAIGGQKKKIKPEMMAPGGGSGGSGGGAIIKSKVVSVPSSALVPVKKSPDIKTGTGSGIIGILETIRANVKQIDEFYKGTLAAKREEIKKRKKQESDDRKADQETKLEKPKIDKKPKNLKGLKMPKTGLLDGIFKFIGTVLMGMLVMKLIDFADTLAKSGILPVLGKIGDFVLDVGGKILDGLVTFIDKAYDFYDGFRKSVGDNFGEGAQEQFDNLSGTLNKVLNTVFSVGLAISLLAGAIPQKDPKVKPKPKTKVKPKPKPKGKGFFGRIGEGFQKAGEGLAKAGQSAVDIGKSGLKAIGGGLNKISGGNLGKLGNFLGKQYNNVSKGARTAFDRVAGLGNTLKGKFGSAMESVKGAIGNMAKSAQNAIVQKIIEPLKPFLDPVIDKAKSIGNALMDNLKKIPGFDNVLQVLKKKGVSGIGDAAGLLKKVGAKALPIVGGLFNLLFAYDRLAGGDPFGALLELMSAGFDISGLFGFVPGPGISLGIDAYMFARDFVPILQEGEEKAINSLGLGGLKSNLDSMASKLPDLGTIVAKFQGKDVEQKSPSQIASTTSGATDGSAAPAASDKLVKSSITQADVQTTSSGSREQTEGSKLSGELGRFLNQRGLRWGSGVTEHPEHGGVKPVHTDGSYHYKEQGYRAIDIGGWGPQRFRREGMTGTDDQTKIIAGISEWNKMKGVTPVEFIHEGNDPTYHNDHVHIAYEGGGYVGGKYNMKSIERRASYEGGEQMINIPIPMPQQQSNYQQPEPAMMGSFSATSSDDPFEFLEFQG